LDVNTESTLSRFNKVCGKAWLFKKKLLTVNFYFYDAWRINKEWKNLKQTKLGKLQV
jgi:hypothetical protein